MTLSPDSKRCQGRIVGVFGAATLARDCTSCVRRTDIPADMNAIQWMQPPVMTWHRVCPAYMAPLDEWMAVE